MPQSYDIFSFIALCEDSSLGDKYATSFGD
jgi:hypothetical protein